MASNLASIIGTIADTLAAVDGVGSTHTWPADVEKWAEDMAQSTEYMPAVHISAEDGEVGRYTDGAYIETTRIVVNVL